VKTGIRYRYWLISWYENANFSADGGLLIKETGGGAVGPFFEDELIKG
jgi:hypothetical protein